MTDRLNSYFYDIESLTNAFTLSCYRPDDERVDIYYLVDDPGLTGQDSIPFKKMAAGEIRAKNQNFRGDIYYLNLHEQTANERLAQAFGLSDARYVNDPEAKSSFPAAFRPTCDTDPDYSPEKAPYFFWLQFHQLRPDHAGLLLHPHLVAKCQRGQRPVSPNHR